MPVSDWADLCVQTIVWKQMTGRDNYGAPTFAAGVSFTGRRVFKNERVSAFEKQVKGQGAEVISASQIWILGTPDIGYDDRVYVQGDSLFPPVLSIERYPDENGDLFVKVLLGSANG